MPTKSTMTQNLTLATWNLQHGGGKRIQRILDTLGLHQEVDVFILTEFRNNQNKMLLEGALEDLGFLYQRSLQVEARVNSVLVASKQPFSSQQYPELGEHSHRVIGVFLEEYRIYACYFPGNDPKKHVFKFLLGELDKFGTEKVIITGDINTGKHYLDEEGATFLHSGYLAQFEEKGLIDAWRAIHGEQRSFSWYSHVGNGFRLDHFYIDKALASHIKSCEYHHGYREEKITDHSMMILELEG